jgi:uncharacterized membrane protein HdeD (DUF308 family)
MMRGMAHKSKSKHRWDTLSLIVLGGLVGLIAGITHNFYDAFRNAVPDDDLFLQLATRAVIYVLAGALVLAVISAIHNWLIQDR